MLGLVNGCFYAMLSLGLAVIFGLLGIVNFAHGALFMIGGYVAWLALQHADIGYFGALLLAPLVVGTGAMGVERLLLKRIAGLDPLYGLLLTFGLALIAEGVFREIFGVSGQQYPPPQILTGPLDLGFMLLPRYRAWVILASLAVCIATWYLIERTRLGATLRAATANPTLVQAFGIDVPRLVTLTYGAGAALAALAGVMAAPVVQLTPLVGSNLIIVVFAVVVIGGMGSVAGSVLTGLGLGVVEGMTKVVYPEASNIVVFVVMAIVLALRPAGLFGREA